MEDPQSFIDTLRTKCNFQLKGSGELNFHLGANFNRDADGTLCMSPTKCVTERLLSSYVKMLGGKPPTTVMSPLDHGDHPELDDSELPDEDGIQQCQLVVGALQWTLSLGGFDMGCAVMSMSSH